MFIRRRNADLFCFCVCVCAHAGVGAEGVGMWFLWEINMIGIKSHFNEK